MVLDLPSSKNTLNVAFYRFAPIEDPACLKQELKDWLSQNTPELKGTLILGLEGINGSAGGPADQAEKMLDKLRSMPGFETLDAKKSWSEGRSFNRMVVKVKKEIIPIGVPGVEPARETGPRIEAEELARWLDEGKEFTLLDTRNVFEVDVGTFEKAKDLGLKTFREFPEKLNALPESAREKPIVMFCTGGIRCEKATAYALKSGFKEVYQLEGGILKYFEKCGSRHYQGECFVFDRRVSLDGELRQATTSVCYGCRAILTPEDRDSPHYQPGIQCSNCVDRKSAEKNTQTHAQIGNSINID